MRIVDLTIHFPMRFISHPYWPQQEQLINIIKGSGMSRARSDDKRSQALNDYLTKIGMDRAEFKQLEADAARQWYRDTDNRIIIPSHQFYGCLIQTADTISSSLRPCLPDRVRSLIHVSNLTTEKTKADGVFRRLVMPKSGSGQPLSNQRSERSNEFIADFDAVGQMAFEPDHISHAADLRTFVEWGGLQIGVGASRKMGVGRFSVTQWHERDATIAEALEVMQRGFTPA